MIKIKLGDQKKPRVTYAILATLAFIFFLSVIGINSDLIDLVQRRQSNSQAVFTSTGLTVDTSNLSATSLVSADLLNVLTSELPDPEIEEIISYLNSQPTEVSSEKKLVVKFYTQDLIENSNLSQFLSHSDEVKYLGIDHREKKFFIREQGTSAGYALSLEPTIFTIKESYESMISAAEFPEQQADAEDWLNTQYAELFDQIRLNGQVYTLSSAGVLQEIPEGVKFEQIFAENTPTVAIASSDFYQTIENGTSLSALREVLQDPFVKFTAHNGMNLEFSIEREPTDLDIRDFFIAIGWENEDTFNLVRVVPISFANVGSEDCANGMDDNNDGLTDCDDSQCQSYHSCQAEEPTPQEEPSPEEIPTTGEQPVDEQPVEEQPAEEQPVEEQPTEAPNEMPTQSEETPVEESPAEEPTVLDCSTGAFCSDGSPCNDGYDAGGWCYFPCASCYSTGWSEGWPDIYETSCSDGIDNDQDGYSDCSDTDCHGNWECYWTQPLDCSYGANCADGSPCTDGYDAGGWCNYPCSNCTDTDTGGTDDGGMRIDTCGDWYITGAESCDDGNLVDGDGCSSSCQLEGDPTYEPTVAPTVRPTTRPTDYPTLEPTRAPTPVPTPREPKVIFGPNGQIIQRPLHPSELPSELKKSPLKSHRSEGKYYASMQMVAAMAPKVNSKIVTSTNTPVKRASVSTEGWGELNTEEWLKNPNNLWRKREPLFQYWEKVAKANSLIRGLHDYYQSIAAQYVEVHLASEKNPLKAFYDYSIFAAYEDTSAPTLKHAVRDSSDFIDSSEPETSAVYTPGNELGELNLILYNPSQYGLCLSYVSPAVELLDINPKNPVYLAPNNVPNPIKIKARYAELTGNNTRLVLGIGNCADRLSEETRHRLLSFKLGEFSRIPERPDYACPDGAEWQLNASEKWVCQCPLTQLYDPTKNPRNPTPSGSGGGDSRKMPAEGYHLECKPSAGPKNLTGSSPREKTCEDKVVAFTTYDPISDPWVGLETLSPAERALRVFSDDKKNEADFEARKAEFLTVVGMMQCVSNMCDEEDTIFIDEKRTECEFCPDGESPNDDRTQCEPGNPEDQGTCPSCSTEKRITSGDGDAALMCLPSDPWQVLTQSGCGPLDCGENAVQVSGIEWGLGEDGTATINNPTDICECKDGFRFKDGKCDSYTPCEEHPHTYAKPVDDDTYDCYCRQGYYLPRDGELCTEVPECPEDEYFNRAEEKCEPKCPDGFPVEGNMCCPNGTTYRDGKCYREVAFLNSFGEQNRLLAFGKQILDELNPFQKAYAQEEEYYQEDEVAEETEYTEEESSTPVEEATPEDSSTPEVTSTPEETPTPEATSTPEQTPTPEVTPTSEETPTPSPDGTDPYDDNADDDSEDDHAGTSPEEDPESQGARPEPPTTTYGPVSASGGDGGSSGGDSGGGSTPGTSTGNQPQNIEAHPATIEQNSVGEGEPVLSESEASNVPVPPALPKNGASPAVDVMAQVNADPAVQREFEAMAQAARDFEELLEKGPDLAGTVTGIITGDSFQQQVENARLSFESARLAYTTAITNALNAANADAETRAAVTDPIIAANQQFDQAVKNMLAVQNGSFDQAMGAFAAVKTALDAALAAASSIAAASAGGKSSLLNAIAARSSFVAAEQAKIIASAAIDEHDNPDGALSGALAALEESGGNILEKSEEIETQGVVVGVLVAVITEGRQVSAAGLPVGSQAELAANVVKIASELASAGLISASVYDLLVKGADAMAKIVAYFSGDPSVSGKDVSKALSEFGLDAIDVGTLANLLTRAGLKAFTSKAQDIETNIPAERRARLAEEGLEPDTVLYRGVPAEDAAQHVKQNGSKAEASLNPSSAGHFKPEDPNHFKGDQFEYWGGFNHKLDEPINGVVEAKGKRGLFFTTDPELARESMWGDNGIIITTTVKEAISQGFYIGRDAAKGSRGGRGGVYIYRAPHASNKSFVGRLLDPANYDFQSKLNELEVKNDGQSPKSSEPELLDSELSANNPIVDTPPSKNEIKQTLDNLETKHKSAILNMKNAPARQLEEMKNDYLFEMENVKSYLQQFGIDSRISEHNSMPVLELRGGGETKLGRVTAKAIEKYAAKGNGADLRVLFDPVRNVQLNSHGYHSPDSGVVGLDFRSIVNPNSLPKTAIHEFSHAFRSQKLEQALALKKQGRDAEAASLNDPYFGRVFDPTRSTNSYLGYYSLDEITAWRSTVVANLATARSAAASRNANQTNKALADSNLATDFTTFFLSRTNKIVDQINTLLAGSFVRHGDSGLFFNKDTQTNSIGLKTATSMNGEIKFLESDTQGIYAKISYTAYSNSMITDTHIVEIPLIEAKGIGDNHYMNNINHLKNQLERLSSRLDADTRSLAQDFSMAWNNVLNEVNVSGLPTSTQFQFGE